MNNNFPISADGILGLDWELAMRAKIDRANCTYTIEIDKCNHVLIPGYHPIAQIPPLKNGHKIKCLSKHIDGIYTVEAPHIITGLYESKNYEWNFLVSNETENFNYLYREQLEITPRDEFIKNTDEYTKILHTRIHTNNSTKNQILREILNNNKSPRERQNALEKFYKIDNYDEIAIYHVRRDTATTIRNNLILDKFVTQLANIEKDISKAAALDIKRIICEYNDIFALPTDPLPAVSDVEHKIKLDTDKIISTPLYKHPIALQPEIDKQIEKFYKQGFIRDSHSPYQSNVWMVPKKLDASNVQKFRMVMDFRKINSHTVQDSYPLPSIEEIMCLLGKAKFISAFDMSNGFHAVKVASEDIAKTAFSTHKGHWEWVRMPQGLINSPATYQRMMNYKLRGLIGNICFVYVDDLIVFGRTLEEYMKNIRIVFDRLRETNLMLNPDKCSFLQQELEYLGHKVTPEGIRPLERNVEKVLNFPKPNNKKELERFIGLASYYRKFIQNFAKRTHHMNRLKGKNVIFDFDINCEREFSEIKKLLSSYPLIAHPDNNKPFILHTDASNQGIGGTLSQIGEDGLEHPISFISRSLNPCERRYSTTEKELLAAQWCMKKCKHLLFGQKFDLYTDHQSLRGIFKNKSNDVSSRIVRLLSKTTDFHPNIIYKRGKENVVADALSRTYVATENIDAPPMTDPLAHIDIDVYNNLRNNELARVDEALKESNNVETNNAQPVNIPSSFSREVNEPCPVRDNPRKYDFTRNSYIWINKNRSESLLSDFRKNKSSFKHFVVSQYITQDDLDLIKSVTKNIYTLEKMNIKEELPLQPQDSLEKGDYTLESIIIQNHLDMEKLIELGEDWLENKMIEIIANSHQEYNRCFKILNTFIYCSRLKLTIRQFLPKYVHDEQTRVILIARLHEKTHWGTDKIYNELKINYTWKGIKNQIVEYIKQCNICFPLRRHLSHNTPGTIIDSPTTPFEILNADIFYRNLVPNLIVIDELTRYIWIITNVNLTQIYKYLKHFFLTNGIPKKLIVDNGPEFRNEKMNDLCSTFGVNKIPIAAYHPESNGVCERVIGTVKGQLEKVENLSYAIYNYNHSIHSTTKRMPISLLYGIKPQTLNEAIDREQELNTIRQSAIENINNSKRINKELVDKRQTCNKEFNTGDIIQIKLVKDGKPFWSDSMPIISCNKNTKTITARCRNMIYTRHFNEIRHYTENREILK